MEDGRTVERLVCSRLPFSFGTVETFMSRPSFFLELVDISVCNGKKFTRFVLQRLSNSSLSAPAVAE